MFDDCERIALVLGREGLWGLRQSDRVPLGGLKVLRNCTLEDYTLRVIGGAVKVGTPYAATSALRAIDYWVDTLTQRTIVVDAAGNVWKDDGSGGAWTLIAGPFGNLTSMIPALTLGGSETLGTGRHCFYADGINPTRVLRGDAATMVALNHPSADWTGTHQPRQFVIHQGYSWAFGNDNLPHGLYRSLATDHEDFTTSPFVVPISSGVGEYLSAGISFKGNLILWKYPDGVWVYDTSNADPTQWFERKIGVGGIAGPHCMTILEDDILWVDPFGGLHLISAVREFGNVRSEDVSARKLGRFLPNTINRQQLKYADVVYYGDKRVAYMACAPLGTTTKTLRVSLDVAAAQDLRLSPEVPVATPVGERWGIEDRDLNAALFMRKVNGVLIPAMVDDVGQLWNLDQPDRLKNGASYGFEWWTHDTDFRQVNPALAGKILNAQFLQVIYDPRQVVTHAIDVFADGVKTNTINAVLSGRGAVLPVVLPFTLGADSIAVTAPYRVRGHARRWSFRGFSDAAGDTSIAGLIFGLNVGE